MQMKFEENFDQVNAGSALTIPVQAGCIKKGGYCMLKGFPCQVIDYATSKPGKHGSAKACIQGVDIFTGKKHTEFCPTSHNIQVPLVKKKEFQVAYIDTDNFVSLINDDQTLKEDLKLLNNEDTQNRIKRIYEENHKNYEIFFTVISACENEKIIAARTKEIKI